LLPDCLGDSKTLFIAFILLYGNSKTGQHLLSSLAYRRANKDRWTEWAYAMLVVCNANETYGLGSF